MATTRVTTNTPTKSLPAEIFGRFLECGELDALAAAINAGHRVIVISGVAGSARALVLTALENRLGRRIIFVTRSNREVEEFKPDVDFFYSALGGDEASEARVLVIPALEKDPYDGTSPHAELLEERALALYRAARGDARILLTSIGALAERTIPPEALTASALSLRAGEDMPLELIVDLLIAGGYVRQEPAGAVGEFSVRGGILDVFSPVHSSPHRIEFFGDTVDSIREFDPDTQRSIGRADECVIVPMREVSIRREELMQWADAARRRWTDDLFARDLRARLAHAERGECFPGWEHLIGLTRPLPSSAFDYFKDAVVVIDEPADIEKAAVALYEQLSARFAEAEDAGELALAPDKLFLTADELRARLDAATRIEFRLLGSAAAAVDERFSLGTTGCQPVGDSPTTDTGASAASWQAPLFLFPVLDTTPDIAITSQSARRYHGRVQDLARDLASELEARSKAVLCAMPSLGLAERVARMLGEYGLTAELLPVLGSARSSESTPASRLVATVGKLSNGFTLPAAGLTVLTEIDIFGEVERTPPLQPPSKRARKQRKAAAFLSDLGDLKVGDYVVHVDHGIGQFQGLTQLATVGGPTGNLAAGLERMDGGVREFMLLSYAEGAKLFVPVERLDLVQRYSSAEGHKPQLDRLGGVSWQKTKARARRAMRDMAEELLKLYAERKLVAGHAYSEDTPWQQEFEDAFEYQLTPDQEAAIEDVKAGMQEPRPMDRLIVGDVGYGKTEVAMRAAFKAVIEGKQAAVLAPTTVLVFQHFKTFQKRFGAFPMRIEMLSRFRSPREQREVVAAIEAGAVDIVVGTHRLLSKDIQFKDLGLLVVDEEQRFGVAHKERIKQMRKKVDVIAMSATPIPRTLNMSLAGLRDMSVIETPPRDRLAIQTHVVQFSDAVIRSAIELELQRGGQAFFVHNRVETIYTIAELIGRLVPQARIGVGHGQMGEKELEEVVLKFIRHELDVLVATTIIENGIDIPLANTIVINRADMYGLSQLYQLRGRVGRSNRRAYAYLLIPSEESLTPIARRRLAAIREFSDLGAGFRIAALDLELRGGGNLLGGEQSGHIDAIGFELYTRMLDHTVRELKGEAVEDEVTTTLNLGVDIRIPQDYIYDASQRLRTYKRVSSAEDDRELADIQAEIADRYGPVPETIRNLFEYARLRRLAAGLGIASIDLEGDRLAVKFTEKARIDADKLVALVSAGGASFTPSGVLKVRVTAEDDAAVFAEVRAVFDRLL
ncbi:MAG TPA: transcription-repair coupling factor [Blastocatellia bacterium]|nr:transcription-repair coupling factor [Blastocatellia bacterium]